MADWKTEYDKTLDNSDAAGVNDGLQDLSDSVVTT